MMNAAFRVARLTLAGIALAIAPLQALAVPADPLVHVVVHVVLSKPQALVDGKHWYCEPGRRHGVVPIPNALLQAYGRELRKYGAVTDHFGVGTWMPDSAASPDIAFEEGDHIDVLTRLSHARRFLPGFLHRLRIDLDQRETLGEIFGGAYGTPAQTRTRILVTLPSSRADFDTVLRIHRIFGDAGHGGATQIADEAGVHIYTGATRSSRSRIERALRKAGLAFTESPETFVTDDAPPCPA